MKHNLGAGIGLKPQHFESVLSLPSEGHASFAPWFEVHTENYFLAGGPRIEYLNAIAEKQAISFHGVGASLGGEQSLNTEHLKQVARLVKDFNPSLISEHAVWSSNAKQYFAELLPMPKTHQALQQLVSNVDQYQTAINRKILIENPTNYLTFISELDEADFLIEAAQRSGCGLLLDLNNLYLSSQNCGLDALAYINKIPVELVGEIHVAGFTPDPNFGNRLLIDSHAEPVSEPVWQLLAVALERFGQTPVLIERDDNIPEFKTLWAERERANEILKALSPEKTASSTIA